MFIATHINPPLPPSTQTALAAESATPSSAAMAAALERFDTVIRDALGRAVYGHSLGAPGHKRAWWQWTKDDVIATLTMVVVFFIVFLVLLILKLLLGMVLLRYSRNRYAAMKRTEHMVSTGQRDKESFEATGRRTGSYGRVEVSDDTKRWLHADPSEGLRGGKGPGRKPVDKDKDIAEYTGNGVNRFDMVAKRIW